MCHITACVLVTALQYSSSHEGLTGCVDAEISCLSRLHTAHQPAKSTFRNVFPQAFKCSVVYCCVGVDIES